MPVLSHIPRTELAKVLLWLQAMHYKENTIRAYDALTDGPCAFLGPRSLLEVKHQDVRDYITHLYERGNSASTMSRQLSGLKISLGSFSLEAYEREHRPPPQVSQVPRVVSRGLSVRKK